MIFKKASTILPDKYLTISQLKNVFFSLKIKDCFGQLSDILRYVFGFVFAKWDIFGSFKDYKSDHTFMIGDLTEIRNYHQISALQ